MLLPLYAGEFIESRDARKLVYLVSQNLVIWFIPALLWYFTLTRRKPFVRAKRHGGFMCPRCLYELEVPPAVDIDLAHPGHDGTTATRTPVHCPECGLNTNVADLYKHWWIGPFDPRKIRKARGFFWPLNHWWAAAVRRFKQQ